MNQQVAVLHIPEHVANDSEPCWPLFEAQSESMANFTRIRSVRNISAKSLTEPFLEQFETKNNKHHL